MRSTRIAVAAVVMAIGAAGLLAPTAAARDDHPWTSLFVGTPYAGAGWSDCPDPIRVSVDSSEVVPSKRASLTKAAKKALALWNRAKVVSFEYGGEIPVRFDPQTGVSRPVDGVERDRWIYLTVVPDKQKSSIDPYVVGLAGPLRLDPATKTILEASAAFRASYVNRVSQAKSTEVIAHEIGHVVGLGHSRSRKDLMYATLLGKTDLGPGDRAGAWALLNRCSSPTTEPTP